AGGAGWRCCMRTPCPEAERAGHDGRPLLAAGGLTQDPPASLGAVGRAVWRTIVEAGSCQDSDALVGTEGYVVPGAKQPSTAHPAIRLAHDIEAQMTRLESVLSLNPAARAPPGAPGARGGPPPGLLPGAPP